MRIALLLLIFTVASHSGCAWLKNEIGGEEFQPWNSTLGSGMRGDTSKSKHSGFFFDRKSQEIEKSLGGGFTAE